MSDDERIIEFPDGWGTAAPIDTLAIEHEGLNVFGILLADGTNIFTLIHAAGARFVRIRYPKWEVEQEHLEQQPLPDEETAVAAAWEFVLGVIKGSRETAQAAERAQRN
jgi:hypothetical protein